MRHLLFFVYSLDRLSFETVTEVEDLIFDRVQPVSPVVTARACVELVWNVFVE